jgi:hypothetical protein
MNGTYETKARWADKIAFFGLFIAVLVLAYFLTVLRSGVVLSEPIKLDFSGLSARIPAGSGWQSIGRWKYEQNSFALDSFFTLRTGVAAATVSLQYLLAAKETSTGELFTEEASAIGGAEIAATGQISLDGSAEESKNGGNRVLEWAQIKKADTLFEMFYGVVHLPNHRRLNIEVYQAASEEDFAEKIFKSIAKSLEFKDNQQLEAGSKIVAEVKNKGVNSFLGSAGGEQERESFFLIKDAAGLAIGFTMEEMVSRFSKSPQAADNNKPAQGSELNILSGNFYYIRGRYEQRTFFKSDNSFNEFVCRSETISPVGRVGMETVLVKEGIMTVRELGWRNSEREYQISAAAIPDALAEFIFSQMLDSDQQEVLADIIDSDGKIIPAQASRIEASQPIVLHNKGSRAGESAYVFKVEFMDGRGFFEQVYLDSQKRVLRRVLQQEKVYTLERSDEEDILRAFPERSSYIQRRKELITENSQPQENIE